MRGISFAAVLHLVLVSFAAVPARAQDEVAPEQPPVTAPPELPIDLWMDQMMRRNWELAPVRAFVSSTVDVGYLYLRPRISLGYGRPFHKWLGWDFNPIFSGDYAGFYTGFRAEIPHVNFRAGTRWNLSYYRTYYDPQDHYDRIAFQITANNKTFTGTYETELEGSYPVGPGNVYGLASVSYVTNVQEGKFAFEESLRLIVDPPWVLRQRVGYLLRWGSRDQHSIGVVADLLEVPKRNDGFFLRTGLLVRIVLSRRVEVRGSFVPTVISPDTIGLAGSDFTELGIRWRWASE